MSLLFENSMNMSCTKCGESKPFIQSSVRRYLPGFPLYWPGRHRGLCKECGVSEYNAKVSIPWTDGKKWEQVISFFDNLETMREEDKDGIE